MACVLPSLDQSPPALQLAPRASTPAGSEALDQQRLRILRCTARAMASSPGGLRFKPGTRPWLEGLTPSR